MKRRKKYILQNRKSTKRKEWERAQINKNIKKNLQKMQKTNKKYIFIHKWRISVCL